MYGLLADLTVAVHLAYVAFVVGGELLILVGWARGWAWVRNFWFRSAHLLAIGAVVFVELIGERCPLTIWEEAFRVRAGQPVAGETFMSRLMYSLLYFDAPVWVFTAMHLAAGAVILATFALCPPRWPRELHRRAEMNNEPKQRGPGQNESRRREQAGGRSGVHEPETTPAQERGERLDTGKAIARGGKEEGHVPGAEPAPEVVTPPAPPGEMPEHEVRKTRAVADALIRLGERADPAAVVADVRAAAGIDLSPEEVAAVRDELIRRANAPPSPDQSPPENARPRADRA